MSDPNTSPVLMTAKALEQMVAHCVAEGARGKEACGFAFSERGSRVAIGTRPITNVHVDPGKYYDTDGNAVVEAYRSFDQNGFEPQAFFHSHLTSPPIMSDGFEGSDMQRAIDTSVAYVIVSLEGDRPKARAYRVRRQFVGVAECVEVPIQVSQYNGNVPAVEYPWALAPGNEVTLTYTRTSTLTGPGVGQVSALVLTCDEDAVTIKGKRTNGVKPPTTLSRSRIRTVVLKVEGDAAAKIRRQATLNARSLSNALAAGDVSLVSALGKAITTAFPHEFDVTMGD